MQNFYEKAPLDVWLQIASVDYETFDKIRSLNREFNEYVSESHIYDTFMNKFKRYYDDGKTKYIYYTPHVIHGLYTRIEKDHTYTAEYMYGNIIGNADTISNKKLVKRQIYDQGKKIKSLLINNYTREKCDIVYKNYISTRKTYIYHAKRGDILYNSDLDNIDADYISENIRNKLNSDCKMKYDNLLNYAESDITVHIYDKYDTIEIYKNYNLAHVFKKINYNLCSITYSEKPAQYNLSKVRYCKQLAEYISTCEFGKLEINNQLYMDSIPISLQCYRGDILVRNINTDKNCIYDIIANYDYIIINKITSQRGNNATVYVQNIYDLSYDITAKQILKTYPILYESRIVNGNKYGYFIEYDYSEHSRDIICYHKNYFDSVLVKYKETYSNMVSIKCIINVCDIEPEKFDIQKYNTHYYQNGNIMKKYAVSHKIRNGKMCKWYENSSPKLVGQYLYGKKHGPFIFYPSGKTVNYLNGKINDSFVYTDGPNCASISLVYTDGILGRIEYNYSCRYKYYNEIFYIDHDVRIKTNNVYSHRTNKTTLEMVNNHSREKYIFDDMYSIFQNINPYVIIDFNKATDPEIIEWKTYMYSTDKN